MEEKKKITSSDKIPGCERLTRPEEIKGLSKYLGAIRETQEEWIERNMPDEPLDLNVENDSEIKRDIEKLRVNEKISALPKNISKLKKEKPIELPNSVISISKNNEPNEIPDFVIGIEDDREIKIDKKRLDLRKDNEITEVPNSVITLDKVIDDVTSLPNSVISISDKKEIELPRKKERLDPGKDRSEIKTDRLKVPGKVSDPKIPEESASLDVSGSSISNLPEAVIGIDPGETELNLGIVGRPAEEKKIDLPKDTLKIYPAQDNLIQGKERMPGDEKKIKLPTTRLDIYPKDVKLPKDKLKIRPKEEELIRGKELRPGEDKEVEIGRDRLQRPGQDKSLELPDILSRPDVGSKEIEEYLSNSKTPELYNDIINALTIGANGEIGGNTKLAGILNAFLGKEEMTADEIRTAAQSLFQYFQTQKAIINAAIIDYPEKRETKESSQINLESIDLKKKVMVAGETIDREESDARKGGESAYFITGDLKGKTPDRVPYKLPDNLFIEYANPDTYIRQLAEIAAYSGNGQGWWEGSNSGLSGFGRRMILDTTLKALIATRRWTEKKLGTNRDRLPGYTKSFSGVVGKVVGVVKQGVNAAKSLARTGNITHTIGSIIDATRIGSDNPNPLNRPGWVKEEIDEDGKKKTVRVQNSGIVMKDALPVNASGIDLTLSDLCGKHLSDFSTIDDLKKELAKSSYITSPSKYIKAFGARGGSMTLDTNAYWEVVMEPLCKKSLNGGWSFLPSIHEINTENLVEHGVNTHYDRWIPLSNIELQKSKLTSKTLGLFDGEISYPVSVEYTNELRMTIIDDQYKSWRRYFQKVADASVYSSEAHDEEWYNKRMNDSNHMVRPSAIDKTKLCIAYYKNVTFNIRVYFMTPQFSTIKKFDLLCVLKDFTEEYYGEIEGGGQDLNVSFSIVGENPTDNNIQYKIDSNGVGGWSYTNGEETVYIGTDVNQAILNTETARSNRESEAASKNQGNGDKPKEETTNGNTGSSDVVPAADAQGVQIDNDKWT